MKLIKRCVICGKELLPWHEVANIAAGQVHRCCVAPAYMRQQFQLLYEYVKEGARKKGS